MAETISASARDATRPVLVEVRDLRVDFTTNRGDVHAVSGIDLDLRVGQIHALVGESGSGKSVTALTMMGLTRSPNTAISGSVMYGGRDLVTAPQSWLRTLRGSELSMVFQDPMTSLNPLHPVGRQIAETLEVNARMSRRAAKEAAIVLLGRVGIKDPRRAADRYPHEFSGGMRQRVVIAIALACEPAVLVADEPTTALDVTVQAQVLDLMVELARGANTAVLLVTHDLGVVAQYAEVVSVMQHGEILEHGPVERVLGDPQHPYTRRLLAAIPRLHGPRRQRLSPPASEVA